MGKRAVTVLLIAVFALFVGGALLLYNSISAEVAPLTASSSGESRREEPAETSGGSEQEEQSVLQAAPDFTVTDMDGNLVSLSDFRGTPVALNFWASWCPPCKAEMPEFDKVSAELEGKVAFLMVDLVDGSQETVETGKAFIQEAGYSFPVYFDESQEAAIAYGVMSIPTTYFIDAQGNIVTGAQGAISEEMLRYAIDLIVDPAA